MFHNSVRAMTVIIALLTMAELAPVFAQFPGRSKDFEKYRPHFIKTDDSEPKNGTVKVTYLGTATLLIDDGETQILTDGFLSRPSVRATLRAIATDTATVDAALKKAKVERLKAVFTAHSHYDHAFDVAYVSKQTKAKLYGSSSTLNIGRGGDVAEEQMTLIEPGKTCTVGKFTVTVLKAKHSPPIPGLNDDLGQTIDKPLKQPALFKEYKEGGAFDFLFRHGEHSFLVTAAGNYVDGSLDKVKAEVMFLSTGGVGMQPKAYQDDYYDHTVKLVKPKLVIPIHWDNFMQPLSDKLEPLGDPAFDVLIERLKADKIKFGILQGYQSVVLFGASLKPE
ncbi:hypothetical protein BH11PLA2_BH11PLA2_02200 [soil metagenome]